MSDRKRKTIEVEGNKLKKRQKKSNETDGKLNETATEIKVMKYVESRAMELSNMMLACNRIKQNKKVTQMLPNHMRRRAASHNAKRLPLRLRAAAEKSMEQSQPTKTKRPSRRHRRRPKNLLAAYLKRQQSKFWLETHIWHAKRFKMMEMWGYKIPLKPSDKGKRAAYRATKRNCTIQDISYYECIQVSGRQEDITSCLLPLFSEKTGLTLKAKSLMKGNREGMASIFKKNSYPFKSLGLIRFLWDPCENLSLNSERKLWIFVHPSSVVETMKEVLDCCCIPYLDDYEAYNEKLKKKSSSLSSTFLHHKFFCSRKFHNAKISIDCFDNKLNRFRLTGPLSTKILKKVFRSIDIKFESGENEYWWSKYYESNINKDIFNKQKSYFNSSLESMADGGVLGLVIGDPRLKSAKADDNLEEGESEALLSECAPENVHISPLWIDDVRKQLRKKISDGDLNKLKEKITVPDAQVELGTNESRIPVILIYRSGKRVRRDQNHNSFFNGASSLLGYTSGWDLIIPSAWGMPFWMSFIYNGCRAVGLEEFERRFSIVIFYTLISNQIL
ncbi:DgyrCDS1521 [Dimorphilus gyrociliatus]|uniref:DgyrCDS1521 n=1 Tax=Dimorphilus gyrociliatus TaxID=2664684 RepID=A0A7I8VCN3_9ANNE|nr:DgyrCDS1521 [Dimorphilus gyrociliatus]